MIGAIAGDIIGSTYEGSGFKRKEFPLFRPRSRFTDDSVLTVVVADVLLHSGDYVATFRDYYQRYPDAGITRHLHEGVLQRMKARATPAIMRLRRCTVERPFSVLKHVIFGNARFLLRGRAGAQTEISLATMAYNLKTMINVLGGLMLANA